MSRQCAAITQSGKRCPNYAVQDSDKCVAHEPRMKEKVAAGRLKGGRGKANAVRARKAIPADLRDVSDVLLQAIRDVESGELYTPKATALATLSRAYVAVYEAGLIESKIQELEDRIAAKVQAKAVA